MTQLMTDGRLAATLAERYYFDQDSPTKLRVKKSFNSRVKAGDVAGQSGRVTVDGITVHTTVAYLLVKHYEEVLSSGNDPDTADYPRPGEGEEDAVG